VDMSVSEIRPLASQEAAADNTYIAYV